jgi:hypothetical protein
MQRSKQRYCSSLCGGVLIEFAHRTGASRSRTQGAAPRKPFDKPVADLAFRRRWSFSIPGAMSRPCDRTRCAGCGRWSFSEDVSDPRRMASGTSAIGAIAPQIGRAEKRTPWRSDRCISSGVGPCLGVWARGTCRDRAQKFGCPCELRNTYAFFLCEMGTITGMITVRHDNAWGVDVSGLSE